MATSAPSWHHRLAHRLKRDAHMLWFAARDPRTPLAAKLVGGLAAAYVLSPIDLLPEFMPVLGILDDLLVITIGLSLAVWLIPEPLADEFRARAEAAADRPVSRSGALLVGLLWLVILGVIAAQLIGLRYW
jgi:uncharacterized membrane protein YkvA (DUF1232 family)